jgi:uncharacterized membrane protein
MSHEKDHFSISFERIVFFSDAVFAIVITLLVLEIKVPDCHALAGCVGEGIKTVSEEPLREALLGLLPKVFGFIFSFLVVGMLWIEHHRIFQYIRAYDSKLIWRNLFFLLFVAFVPFPTALFSEYVRSKTAFILYALSFAFASAMKYWLWRHAAKNKAELLIPGMDEEVIKRISRRTWAVPLGCAVCIILAIFLPVGLSWFGFLLIPLFARLLYPVKKIGV